MLQSIVTEAKQKMNDAIVFYEEQLAKISTGQASPSMLNGVKVDYYGEITPINQIASISTPNARQLMVKPFDRTQLEVITNAINSSNLGFNANDSGDVIRINIPPLTEETRVREAKKVGEEVEKGKIVIRQIRQDANSKIKLSEATDDDKKGYSEDVQDLVKEFNTIIEEKAKEKEKHIIEI